MAEEADGGEMAMPAPPAGHRGLFFWAKLALLALVVLAAGGAGWYFFLGGRDQGAGEIKAGPEPTLPFFVEIKPFVVTMPAADGATHYVQLGLSLKVPGASAGDAITAVLPEVQDAIRQSVLGAKIEQVESPAGVDKLRALLVVEVNRILTKTLGAERVRRLGGTAAGALVQNIYFSTLVVE